MIGRPATGTSGLGIRLVSGRRREPSPPAMTTAFISLTNNIVGVTLGFRPRDSAIQVAAVLGASEHARARIPWMRNRARAGGNNAMRPHGRRRSGLNPEWHP